MTHTKHRKRRERADRERLNNLPGYDALSRALAAPLDPRDQWWGPYSNFRRTLGRTGRAG